MVSLVAQAYESQILVFMESSRVYEVLFLVTFPFHSKPKGREAGLYAKVKRFPPWPLRISCGQWDGLLPQGCLTGPKVAQRLPQGNLERTEVLKHTSGQKDQWWVIKGPGQACHLGLPEEPAGPRNGGRPQPATEMSLGREAKVPHKASSTEHLSIN